MSLVEVVPAGEQRQEDSRVQPRSRLVDFLLGRRRDPIPSYQGLIEPAAPDKIGICCSGGGIRSAAFNLGALQELQGSEVLQRAKYLAAVSGGSYIAAAFAMVAKTRGQESTQAPGGGSHTGSDDSDPDLVNELAPPFYPGSPEEQYLRNRTSYLAPGILGKIRVTWRVVLGLTVNLTFIGLFLFVVGRVLGWIYARAFPGLRGQANVGGPVPFNSAAVWVVGGLVLAAVVFGFLSLLIRPSQEPMRLFLETWSLRFFAVALFVSFFAILLPELVELVRNLGRRLQTQDRNRVGEVIGTLGGGGLVSIISAAILQLKARVAGPADLYKGASRASLALRSLASRLRLLLAYVAGAVLGPLILLSFLVAVVADTTRTPEFMGARGAQWAALTLVWLFFYYKADLTAWSMHPYYKRRLCTAFALKRVKRSPEDACGKAEEREYGRHVPLSSTGVEPGQGFKSWPTLLVCAAANVSDQGVTPPGRPVTSFVFSAKEMGGPLVGGISTRRFEDRLHPRRKRDFTLPAAVAVSGAALSPSMGKLTRRPLTFLMALANVRLGVWLPNPRRVPSFTQRRGQGKGKHPKRFFFPRPRPSYLVRELLGRNRVNDKFLYVTDGGHYENLGLVELLRRGCTRIYCFDASGDPPDRFQSLGDAVALARSELGVEIDVDPTALQSQAPEGHARDDCVVGEIRYPDGVVGWLAYSKTVVTDKAPWDIHAYHQLDRRFPTHSTSDQLYTDQKFEAYRALGACAARSALEKLSPVTPEASSPSAGLGDASGANVSVG